MDIKEEIRMIHLVMAHCYSDEAYRIHDARLRESSQQDQPKQPEIISAHDPCNPAKKESVYIDGQLHIRKVK